MPPGPKVRGIPGQVREAEVLHQIDAQEPGGAPGDVGVAGEIPVDLKGEGDHAQDGPVAGKNGAGGEGIVGQHGAVVGHEDLFEEAYQHQAEAVLQVGGLKAAIGLQLGDELVAPLDGPRNQLREKGVEDRKGDEVAAGRSRSPVNIEDIAQGLEGVKGDAHRQDDLQQHRAGLEARSRKQRPGRLDEEAEILEKSQDGETETDAEDQKILASPLPAPGPQRLMRAKKQQPQARGQTQDPGSNAGTRQEQAADAEPGRRRQGQEQGLEGRGPFAVNTQAAEKIDDRGGQHQGQETHVPATIEDIAGRQQQEQPLAAGQEPIEQEN